MNRGRFPGLGPVSIYAVVALLGTAFFFFLHILGNQVPYDLAQQRFAAESSSNRPDEGHALGFKGRFEYCQLSLTVMAGARKTESESPLIEAVLLKVFRPGPGYCDRLDAVLSGTEPSKTLLKSRYWWGNKALYAMALRYLSVYDLRELTRVSTYLAYVLLAVSLLLLSPRTLLVAAPLIVFGVFFSGIRYWADVANGMPYLWAVLSAALLAVLMRGRASRWSSPGTVRRFCFIMGMVSSWLWLGDGHTFLAVTLIGMVAWFGHGQPDRSERARRATSCMALYLVGFVTCYALMLLTKIIVASGVWEGGGIWTWRSFLDALTTTFERTVSGERTLDLEELLRHFYLTAVGWDYISAGDILTCFLVFALLGSVLFAALQARRGRFNLLWDVSWIVGLILVNCPQFLVTEDVPFRTARFMFVPYALCLSCLVLALMGTSKNAMDGIFRGFPLETETKNTENAVMRVQRDRTREMYELL